MKVIAFLAVAASAMALSGCAGVAKSLPATIDALDKAYERCERDVTFQVRAGAMNPSSGVEVNGKYHCPPKASAPSATPAATAAAETDG